MAEEEYKYEEPRIHKNSKYKDEFPEMLIKHMTQGKQYQTFAAAANVSIQTIYDWEKRHPEFAEAKAIGKPKLESFWEDIYIRAVLGLPVEIDGKVLNPKYNATLIIFAKKNISGWRDITENHHKATGPLPLAYALPQINTESTPTQ